MMGWTTIIFGLLLYISDKFQTKQDIENSFTVKNAIVIGCFQVLALVPGVSRSGITITSGRFLGFSRFDSAKISFFLSIPALAGASILGFNDIQDKSFEFNLAMYLSVLFSFTFSKDFFSLSSPPKIFTTLCPAINSSTTFVIKPIDF